jgi:hypothetical protein
MECGSTGEAAGELKGIRLLGRAVLPGGLAGDFEIHRAGQVAFVVGGLVQAVEESGFSGAGGFDQRMQDNADELA